MVSHVKSDDVEATGNVIDLPSRTIEETRPTALDFIRAHPGIAIAGGLAAGMLVASLLPGRPARKLRRRTVAIADVVGTAAALFGRQALQQAESAGTTARREGSKAFHQAEDLGSIAARSISAVIHGVLDRAEEIGGATASRAERIGDEVAKRTGQVGDLAEGAAHKAGKRIGKAVAGAKSRIIG